MSRINQAPHPLWPCLHHVGALVSDWHCQERTKLARRGKYEILGEIEAALCLACPRGGNEKPQPKRTYVPRRADRRAARRAFFTPVAERARSCIEHRQEMRFAGRWYCRACDAQYARQRYRHAKGGQKEATA
ncbi:MAG: hypothetical protein ACOZHQ_09370 [Thermodesulfobacteriota bacterium]